MVCKDSTLENKDTFSVEGSPSLLDSQVLTHSTDFTSSQPTGPLSVPSHSIENHSALGEHCSHQHWPPQLLIINMIILSLGLQLYPSFWLKEILPFSPWKVLKPLGSWAVHQDYCHV